MGRPLLIAFCVMQTLDGGNEQEVELKEVSITEHFKQLVPGAM